MEVGPPPSLGLDLEPPPIALDFEGRPLDLEPPPFGLDMDYQGPLNLGPGVPPLVPSGPTMPMQGFVGMPPGSQPGPALGLAPPGMPPPMQGLPGGDLPPGLPPGFPPMAGMPPGLPPGFPPGFAPPGAAPVFGPSGPLGAGPPEGPGRPEFAGIGPPPSEPPPSWQPSAGSMPGSAASAGTEAVKRKRGVEGLASNRNIKSGGSVTVYSGYDAQSMTVAPGQARKASSAPAAVAAAVAAAAPASSSAFQGVQGREALSRQLPEGWEMKKSRSTGKVYYVNEKLGKSQFEPPAGSSVKASPQKKKQKASHRAKDGVDAQLTAMNGVMGVVRATDQNTARWKKWQKCSQVVNTEPERDE